MRKRIDLTGQRFGRLVVIAPSGDDWLCRCDCGAEIVAAGKYLRRGSTRSCGCLRAEVSRTHGLSDTPEYNSWHSMLHRCEMPTDPRYRDYGGRGIKVCERWHDFGAFYDDMGERPANTTLGRIDNDGDYEPENCRWETVEDQAWNRRNTCYIEAHGRNQTLLEWAVETGLKTGTIYSRLWRGATPEDAVSPGKKQPPKRQKHPELMYFTQRTSSIYGTMKSRAAKAGAILPFSLSELRAKLKPALGTRCFYCGCVLTMKNISADHEQPISRGGGWELSGVAFICRRCNYAKAALTRTEFKQLTNLLDEMDPAACKDVIGRLKAGGSAARIGLKRSKTPVNNPLS